jgi:NADH:ubiquinone oxidoreductase subunit F (NADH-binding)
VEERKNDVKRWKLKKVMLSVETIVDVTMVLKVGVEWVLNVEKPLERGC